MSKTREEMTPEDWKLVWSLAEKCSRCFWEHNGSPRAEKDELVVVDARHMPGKADYTRLQGMAQFFDLDINVIISAFNNRFQTHYGCLLLGYP